MCEETDGSPAWHLTDHACRYCFGRVLRREADDGVVARCANCGATATGDVKNLCCCGLKTKRGQRAGLECGVNHDRSANEPAEIVVYWTGPSYAEMPEGPL